MERVNEEIEHNEVVNINYSQPKFWHRVMANFIDFFLLLVFFFSFFISARSIVLLTPKYKQAEQTIVDTQLASGLYVKDVSDNDKIVDIVFYIDKTTNLYGSEFDGVGEGDTAPLGKNGKAVNAIYNFINYCSNPDVTSPERYEELVTYYDEIRLDTLTGDGLHYYVKRNLQRRERCILENNLPKTEIHSGNSSPES